MIPLKKDGISNKMPSGIKTPTKLDG